MKFNFNNVLNVNGDIDLISSKSVAQRLILIASFNNKNFTINNIDFNEDIKSCFDCMKIINNNLSYDVKKKQISVFYQKKLPWKYFNLVVDVKSSATLFRMLSSILSQITHNIKIKSSLQLQSRNIDSICDFSPNTLLNWPIKIVQNTNKNLILNGNVSSQYISGMIISMCLFNPDLKIKLINVSSIKYIILTIHILKKFGYNIKFKKGEISLLGIFKTCYENEVVDGDWTHAINFFVLKFFYPNINIKNLVFNSFQADEEVLKILNEYKNISRIDGNLFIDSIPILCAFFAILQKEVTFYNITRLKYKESNRIKSIIRTLENFNVDIKQVGDKLIIKPSNLKLINSNFDSFNDHRICFVVVIMSLILNCDVNLKNSYAILKSYPNFYEQIEGLITYN